MTYLYYFISFSFILRFSRPYLYTRLIRHALELVDYDSVQIYNYVLNNPPQNVNWFCLGLWLKRHFHHYCGYMVAVSIIGGEIQSTPRKLPTCLSEVTNKLH
jgi:hypothetical protein